MPDKKKYLDVLAENLSQRRIGFHVSGNTITCSSGRKKFLLHAEQHSHLIVEQPLKLASLIQSKLGLNRRVFARNCMLQKIDKATSEKFLETYHIMSFTQSAYNYGLFDKNGLLAVASFSKGRKMNRLPEDKRSFELIRFCCLDGITVTGGLTRLVKNFCREKNAGDVMTYVDRQFSDGGSFIKAGFVKHSETEQNVKLIYTP